MAPDYCSRCGRSCGCLRTPITWTPWWETVTYSSERYRAPRPPEPARNYADELREMRRAHRRHLAELRRADKAAARRDELLSPTVHPLPPPRSPKRNRVCSKAELWRAWP